MASKPFPSLHNFSSADANDLVGILTRLPAEVDVVNTAVATTIFTFSIPANAMSTDRMCRLTVLADYLNDTGVARDVTVNVSLGGVVLANVGGSAIAASASRYAASFRVEFGNRGAAASQMIATWIPDFSSVNRTIQSQNTTAVDTTIAQTLLVQVTHPVASASLSYRKRYAMLELL